MIRTFTSPTPLSSISTPIRAVVLLDSNVRVLSTLGEHSGSGAALLGSLGRSIVNISSWRLVLYICGRVQAEGKGFGGRRAVRIWRGFPFGSFPHAPDLVAARRSIRTHRYRPCSRAGSSGRRLGAGNPGCRSAARVLSRLALGCRRRRRRRSGSDVDECLPLRPPHPAADPRRWSPVRDAAALSRL